MDMIFHEPVREYVYPIGRNKLAVRLRVGREYAHACTIHYWNWGRKEGVNRAEMKCYARDNRFDYFEAVITEKEAIKYFQYYFQVVNRAGKASWLNYHGVQDTEPEGGIFQYNHTNEDDIYRVPAWARGAVAYQIFPERFCNGDKSNDPPGTEPWGSVPKTDHFMGGDLAGILEKIDYIAGLGIDLVYLNPIFKAPSNHKYDTVDYMMIDPAFGDMDIFRGLVNELHRRGIRVLLDGVFNHCGYLFPPFQDVLEKGEQSPHRDWFYIENFPVDMDKVNYESFGYFNHMPRLRVSHPEVRDCILKVGRYWIEEGGIDGWRLDVADCVDYTFWQLFRKEMKAAKPDCFLLGETWVENLDTLRGDQMDSVMNYVFRDAAVDFFAGRTIGSRTFDARLNHFLGTYPDTAYNVLYNPLDSHDTDRFLTLCGGNKDALRAAVAFQLCFPGMPAVYYGDEVGLDGGYDPDCRKAMEWDIRKQDAGLLSWYRDLIALRHRYMALRYGTFACNYADGQVYGFFRAYEGERVYIAINNNDVPADITLPLLEGPGETVHDLFTDTAYRAGENKGGYNSDIHAYAGSIKLHFNPWQICVMIKRM